MKGTLYPQGRGEDGAGHPYPKTCSSLPLPLSPLLPWQVKKMMQALTVLEKCLQMAIRSDNGELIQDTSILAWNAGLFMLQPNLRHHVKTIMHIAAEALENIASPLTELRSLLHLEMTNCELADELVQKADSHVNKALGLDYYVDEEESGKYDLLRCLWTGTLTLTLTLRSQFSH